MMNKYVTPRRLLALLVSYLLAFSVQGQTSTEERIAITTITPSLNTGQDYSPWLDDNLNNLVQNSWQSNNFQYVDVTLTLAKTTVLSRLSLFDYQGIFLAQPALIYAQNGTQRTLIGTFDGALYNVWVDMTASNSITADAIVIHKYCNNIPVKIKVFGRAGITTTTPTTPTAVASALTFGALASKTVGDAPFALTASSTNTLTAIGFSSSNANVVSVAQTSTGTWQATVVGAGTATITAAQAAGNGYLAAAGVGQAVTVQAAPVVVASVLTFGALAGKTVGDAPFALAASSTNTVTAITFSSSNSAVVSVAQTSAGTWQATVVGAGTATITAVQAAGNGYLAAAGVSQSVAVQAAPVVVVVTPPTTTNPTTPTGTTTTGKIPIDASRWYQLTNAANTLAPLFDGSVATSSAITWGKVIPTYDSYYALQPGETINLQSIKFYDGAGTNPSDPMTLSIITDTWQRIPVATFTGSLYNTWVGPDPNQPANFNLPTALSNIRYLVITASFAYPTEMELYGTYTAGTALPATDVPALAVQKQIKLSQEFGVNGFEWDVEDPNSPGTVDATRLTAVKNFTGFRHYLDWQKLESTQGGYTYNPVHSGGWNYDAMYTSLKANGVTVLACLKTLPDWLLNTYPNSDRELENVPVAYGQDFSNPNSYLAQAKVAFQYAARYGANASVPASLVTVDQSTRWAGDGVNQVKIGLNLVHYIECDNERDKWWKGRKAYQTGREYAANLSAFYDGNKNTMGAGVGVKNADPTMQVVMAGLANPSADYVRGMIDWCRQFRGYKADGSVNLCWDVINYHYYSNNAGTSQGGNASRGSAPEVVTTAQVAQEFIKVAHQYAADMPVWVTEAGYDQNQGSPLKAIAIGGRTVAQTQADWTLRTALLYARWGVERTFFYMLTDDNANSAVQFSSSGLVNSDRSARPVADFLRQANQLLGAYVYTGTLNADPLVDRYQLGSKTAYALVVPDETGRTATYTLSLGTDSATIYLPRAGTSMQVTRVRTQSGQLTLTVTETPQFVVAGNSAVTTTPPTTACTGTGSIGWEQWTNMYSSTLAGIPTSTTPNNTAILTSLQSTYGVGDFYGARIRGYVCAPQTGSYTFEIAGDDDCELWLSTDATPANKTRIAYVSGWTNVGEWNKYSTQQAAAVTLQANTRYYLEVLHRDGSGGDFVAVGWKLPSGQTEAPIAGSHLIPYTATTTSAKTAARSTAALVTVPTAGVLTQPALLVYPNPFSSEASLSFTLPEAGTATLELYDAQNRLVRRLYSNSAEAGQAQRVALDGAGLSAGFYLVRLVTGSTVLTQKLVKAD